MQKAVNLRRFEQFEQFEAVGLLQLPNHVDIVIEFKLCLQNLS
jgi:hypothetical protein